jgi:succinate-semialdehyde dehydrogenase/glutarate-semialdehyde dehydrogenase
MPIQTVNPNTNKIIKSFEEMTEKTVEWTVVDKMINNCQWGVVSKRFIAVEARD